MNWRVLLGSLVVIGPLSASADAQAPPPRCQVPSFSGALSPLGAMATMRVVNDGRPCGVTLYGVPAERRNPATDGVILKQPKHGKAEFIGAHLQYTPNRGFVGEDAFSGQAMAIGETRTQYLMKVHMTVQVVAVP